MDELKDYSGPFIPDLRYGHFSKEVLVELLKGYSMEINTLAFFYGGEIRKRFGTEVAREININVWKKMAHPEMDCPIKAANISGNDVETFCKVNQLVGSFAQDYYRYEFDLKNKNHAILTIHECPAFSMLEKRNELDELDWNCSVLEMEGMKAYRDVLNPAIKITPLRVGRRSSPDEPACKWEFKIEQ